jgi:hypothetical protein
VTPGGQSGLSYNVGYRKTFAEGGYSRHQEDGITYLDPNRPISSQTDAYTPPSERDNIAVQDAMNQANAQRADDRAKLEYLEKLDDEARALGFNNYAEYSQAKAKENTAAVDNTFTTQADDLGVYDDIYLPEVDIIEERGPQKFLGSEFLGDLFPFGGAELVPGPSEGVDFAMGVDAVDRGAYGEALAHGAGLFLPIVSGKGILNFARKYLGKSTPPVARRNIAREGENFVRIEVPVDRLDETTNVITPGARSTSPSVASGTNAPGRASVHLGEVPYYNNPNKLLNDEAQLAALSNMKSQGRYLDDINFSSSNLNAGDVNYVGTSGGRPVVSVQVPGPDGNMTTQYFYKSTGLGGKTVRDADGVVRSTEGMWQPFGGFANVSFFGGPKGREIQWFIKDAGYKDFYGSNAFENIAENLDDLTKNQFLYYDRANRQFGPNPINKQQGGSVKFMQGGYSRHQRGTYFVEDPDGTAQVNTGRGFYYDRALQDDAVGLGERAAPNPGGGGFAGEVTKNLTQPEIIRGDIVKEEVQEKIDSDYRRQRALDKGSMSPYEFNSLYGYDEVPLKGYEPGTPGHEFAMYGLDIRRYSYGQNTADENRQLVAELKDIFKQHGTELNNDELQESLKAFQDKAYHNYLVKNKDVLDDYYAQVKSYDNFLATQGTQQATMMDGLFSSPVDNTRMEARTLEAFRPVYPLESKREPFAQKESSLSGLHTALGVVGMVPIIGEPFNLLDAALYSAEGDYLGATLSGASAIPFFGNLTGGLQAGKNAFNTFTRNQRVFNNIRQNARNRAIYKRRIEKAGGDLQALNKAREYKNVYTLKKGNDSVQNLALDVLDEAVEKELKFLDSPVARERLRNQGFSEEAIDAFLAEKKQTLSSNIILKNIEDVPGAPREGGNTLATMSAGENEMGLNLNAIIDRTKGSQSELRRELSRLINHELAHMGTHVGDRLSIQENLLKSSISKSRPSNLTRAQWSYRTDPDEIYARVKTIQDDIVKASDEAAEAGSSSILDTKSIGGEDFIDYGRNASTQNLIDYNTPGGILNKETFDQIKDKLPEKTIKDMDALRDVMDDDAILKLINSIVENDVPIKEEMFYAEAGGKIPVRRFIGMNQDGSYDFQLIRGFQDGGETSGEEPISDNASDNAEKSIDYSQYSTDILIRASKFAMSPDDYIEYYNNGVAMLNAGKSIDDLVKMGYGNKQALLAMFPSASVESGGESQTLQPSIKNMPVSDLLAESDPRVDVSKVGADMIEFVDNSKTKESATSKMQSGGIFENPITSAMESMDEFGNIIVNENLKNALNDTVEDTFGFNFLPEDKNSVKIKMEISTQEMGPEESGDILISSSGVFDPMYEEGKPVIVPTEEGVITTEGIPTDLVAISDAGELKYLPANSGNHQFEGKIIKEYPADIFYGKDGGLADWFKEEWVRIDTEGNITGPCGTMKKGKATTRCLPKKKAQSLTKAERKATARKKVRGSKKGKQFVANTKKAKVKKRDTKRYNDGGQTPLSESFVMIDVSKADTPRENKAFTFADTLSQYPTATAASKALDPNDIRDFLESEGHSVSLTGGKLSSEELSVLSGYYNTGQQTVALDGGELPFQTFIRVTGLPWHEARKRGLTDGSYEMNVALQNLLLAGKPLGGQLKSVNKQSFADEEGLIEINIK